MGGSDVTRVDDRECRSVTWSRPGVIFVDANWEDYPKWLPHFARLTRQGGMLVSDNLFPLFEDWAQDLAHKESIQEYLTALVHDSRFKTHIARDKWQALSYRV